MKKKKEDETTTKFGVLLRLASAVLKIVRSLAPSIRGQVRSLAPSIRGPNSESCFVDSRPKFGVLLRRFAAQVRSLAPVGLGCLQESSESCSVDSRPKFGVLLRLAPAFFKKVRSLALVGARVADFEQISGAGEAEIGPRAWL